MTPTQSDSLLDELARLSFQDNLKTWRDQVATDLNLLVEYAANRLETEFPTSSDVEIAEAILRIVKRVAEFEEIRRKP